MIDAPDTPLVNAVRPSPNVEPRRGGVTPDLLLLHYTGMASCAHAIDWLTAPQSRVSCHYVIDEAGVITQLVAEAERAWHAGEAVWQGETDINSRSVGIEIHNRGHDDGYPDFPDAQMSRLEALCLDIVGRWRIRPERVLAHSDVAPHRKIDPGEKFDWRRLKRTGIGHWVEPVAVDASDAGLGPDDAGASIARAQDLLARYGYGVASGGRLDHATGIVLKAFQRHFRPDRVDGRLDRSTLATLERLVAALDPGVA